MLCCNENIEIQEDYGYVDIDSFFKGCLHQKLPWHIVIGDEAWQWRDMN